MIEPLGQTAPEPDDYFEGYPEVLLEASSRPSMDVDEDRPRRRAQPGGDAILDDAAELVALWGDTDAPLWAAGESLFVVGPIGVGKTTLAQRLMLARLGVTGPRLLDRPVAVDARPFLYIAADRPRQAKRSLRRMVTEDQRDMLNERLMFWEGPLPFSLVKEPWRLAVMIQEYGCAGAFVDSLKDVAVGLSADEVGGQVNMAFQECSAVGLELLINHHQRKGTADNRRPKALEDVYGSTWLTAGAGSVVILWGAAGDPLLELHHLKQPAEEVGPLSVRVDHMSGSVDVSTGGPDLLSSVRGARRGITPTAAAVVLFGVSEPDKNQVERARRKLNRLVASGLAHKTEGGKDASGRQVTDLYFATTSEEGR